MVSFITTLCLPVWHARKHMKPGKHVKQLMGKSRFCFFPSQLMDSFVPCQLNFEIVFFGPFDVSV